MQKNMQVNVNLGGADNASARVKSVLDKVNALTSRTQAARDQLKNISITQNQIKGFEKLRTEAVASGRALQEARAKAKALGDESRRNGVSSEAYRKAVTEVKRLSESHDRLMLKTKSARQALEAKGVATNRLSDHTRRLREESERLIRTEQRLEQAQRRAADLRAKAGRAAMAGAKMLAGGYVIGRGLSGMMGPGMEFDAQMSKVQALTRLQDGSAELAALRAQAKQLGATTSFTGGDVASGQAFLAMAGFTPDAIRAAMPGLLDMAKAGGIDLGRGADISSNILSAFGINPEEMDRVADVLTRTFTTANTNLEMLGGTMKYVAPIAKAAGMSFEESAAMAGLMGNIGIQDSMAGTQLRAMVNRLAAPAARGKQALEELGVSAVDAQGNMRSMPQVLFEIAKATERMGSGQRLEMLKHIFGEEASAGLSDLIGRAGSDELRKYIEVVQSSKGAAKAVAGTMANNLQGDLMGLSSATEALKIGFSEANSGWIRALVDGLTSATRSAAGFINDNPRLVKALSMIAAALAVILVVGGALMVMLGGLLASMAVFKIAGVVFLPALKAALVGTAGAFASVFAIVKAVAMFIGGALLAALKAVFVFLMANPIVLVIMAIVGALYLLYRNWDTVLAFIQTTWQGLSTWFTTTKDQFVGWGSEIIAGLIQGITGGAAALWEGLKSTVGGAVNKVRDFLGIRSPSRVFAELGGFTAAGLAMGIAHGTPAVVSTAQNMAQQVSAVGAPSLGAGAVGMSGAAGGAGAVSIGQVTIVIDGASGDPAAIAQAVQAELRKMGARAQSESRARFYEG